MIRRPPRSTLFPTRRSSDLPRSLPRAARSQVRELCRAPRGFAPGCTRGASLPVRVPERDPLTSSCAAQPAPSERRSEEHTSELQSRQYLVCRLLLEKKKNKL